MARWRSGKGDVEMCDFWAILVICVSVLVVILIASGDKITSDTKDKLIKAQRKYIYTLESGIEIRDRIIQKQQSVIDNLNTDKE